MKKYRVDSTHWNSNEFDDYHKALTDYEETKEKEMETGVSEDSYVELVFSENRFEDYEVLKRAIAVEDMERMKQSTPREEGQDWDYWAKWVEVE